MALIRRTQSRDLTWNPFRELEQLQSEMNRLFGPSLSRWSPTESTALLDSAWAPAMDIYDTKDSFVVKADLPGMTKDEIEVAVDGDELILKGKKQHEEKTDNKGYLREERFYGSFYRSIPLPSGVDTSKAQAVYKNGVLELTLPKKEEVKPKQINVEVK